MKKAYDSNEIEQKIYEHWEQSGYFKPQGKGESYCIMIPPPNVTGSLHMGHGFQNAIMDALIRFHRMKGNNTLWQPGMDHAGIATQMVVERRLLTENKTRHEIGRESFVEKVWEWKGESGDRILQQSRRLGASADWSRACFTMDEHFVHAVQDVFIRLYEEGLIYRGKRLVNWDPVLQTAISDLEVVNTEEAGHLWHIRYPIVDSDEQIIIATTRPETLLGDTAVAVHPDDERYQHLVGKFIQLPLTDRKIPIIADHYVERDFGTGCVKITPAHDFNDYAVGHRHKLPVINILTIDAHINENAPERYQGLDRFEARELIIQDLKAQNLLEKIEDYALKVPRGDRSHTVIEPWLTDQWFVKTESLAKPAIDVVKQNKIRFIPETWAKTYFQWMENIEDWCISRQLWWGHRIPAWYDEEKNIYVGHDEAAVREKYNLPNDLRLKQEDDVLDTWFSSALWPFATLGWPDQTDELKTFYPTNVLVTGFDIIFFWVARMIMFGLKFMKEIPFSEVYITGLIRDQDGQKMSKSKGNILDPLDLIDGISLEDLLAKRTYGLMQPAMAKKIEKATRQQFPEGIAAYGTDALRMTFCALAGASRDISFDFGRLEGYRNFCNKLWNATRYILMQTEKYSGFRAELIDTKHLTVADRWILSRLQKTIQTACEHFKSYRFDLLVQALYEFTWREYCDWYLEFTKSVLMQSEDEAAIQSTLTVLVTVLEAILRFLHPIIPFITEELWKNIAPFLGNENDTIMLQPYPEYNAAFCDESAEQEVEWIKAVILAIRNMRGEMNVKPNQLIPLYFTKGTDQDAVLMKKHDAFLKTLSKLETISPVTDECVVKQSATALINDLEILIPLEGLVDLDAEIKRLEKEIAKLQKDIDQSEKKLSNPNFVERAPKEVVKQEEERLTIAKIAIEKLKRQVDKVTI